ncbi:hypothetical protein BDQ17DRAFT_1330452 [Cyathus striatus]|nr:hypothetical protein BDQ17DRAFT_1330452 [Cyathus striatus]
MSCFTECLNQGAFDLLYQELFKYDEHSTPAHRGLEYGENFLSTYESDSKRIFFGKDLETNMTKTIFMFFGQVASKNLGTKMSAKGNNTKGPITDSTHVKDVLVIQPPDLATPQLQSAYNNQIALLYDAYQVEKNTHSDFHNIYNRFEIPTNNPSNEANFVPKKKKLSLLPPNKMVIDSEPTPKQATASKAENFYEPSNLPDYQGSYYQLNKAKLVQQDFKDVNGSPIRPWEVHDKLRPGTLVVIDASLIEWIIPDCFNPSLLQKTFQLIIKNLQVFAKSDLPIEIPSPELVESNSSLSQESSLVPSKRNFKSLKTFKGVQMASSSNEKGANDKPTASTSGSKKSRKMAKNGEDDEINIFHFFQII